MSENKKYFYLKLKDSFFSSEEMLVLESVPNGMIYQNIYLRMCLLSLKNEGALTFKDMLPYDLKMLSTVLRVDIAQMKMALELFEQLGLVTKTDNEVLFMSDIQTLIGQSSTEAERIARYRRRIVDSNNITKMLPDSECTKSVQMLQTCTPETELEKDLKTEKKKDIEFEKTQKDFSVLMETVFSMISEHNRKQTEAKRKIAISKDLFTFESKEGRTLVDLIKSRTPQEIISALKNYLYVANMKNTWVNMFTFNAFCKGLDKYLPDYFDYEAFADYRIDYDHTTDPDLIFVNKMENEPDFNQYLFDRHVKEWVANGCPEGKEYYRLQETWR